MLPFLAQSQNSRLSVEELEGAVGDTLKLSKTFLVPYSEQVFHAGQRLVAAQFELDYQQGLLMLTDSSLSQGKVQIEYRYFSNFLRQEYAFRSFKVTRDSTGAITGREVISSRYFKEQQITIETAQIRKSGSISRGITVGNRQNLSVQSGLRLQVEGDLGEDLKLVAAITDDNIPIQPDGSTQQISDFDKVFIQLKKGNSYVILGDFEINHQGTAFANFYRNVQGIGLRIQEKGVRAGISGAVAKGKFHTNSFIGQEGVQGPYRLSGRNNERFIIVLAGSEKVYLNGQLMTRGEANDYTIDYNSGELTFTAQQIISTASRIVVDFEYTDRNYNRSTMFGDVKYSFLEDRVKLAASYGRDADNQNAPIEGDFSETELDTLEAIGDRVAQAFVSGVDSIGPPQTENDVRYLRRDTTVVIQGQPFTLERYLFSRADTAIFQIIFSNVGSGNGYYVRDQQGINGAVFRWVAPDSLTGQPLGDWAPVKVLVAPRLLQVVDLQGEYNFGKRAKVYTELAISSEDKNRFSSLDNDDNYDVANKTGVRFERLKLGDSLEMRVDVSHRFVGARYTNLDRVYKVEYGREWNFDDLGERLTENVSEGLLELRYKNSLKLTANAGMRTYGDQLFSIKQNYGVESSHKWLQGKYKFVDITTRNQELQSFSRWMRHNGDIYKQIGKLQPGTEIWIEDKKNETGNALQSGTFRFYDLKPYLKTKGIENFNLHLYYNFRQEAEFADSAFRDKSLAHTGYAKISWQPKGNFNLQNTSTFRDFQVLDSAFVSQGLENSRTVITNFQGSWFAPKRLVFANLIYEITSEQLARKEVTYVEVNEGQGQYEWIDIDSNEVQSLDEFQLSTNPLRANYIRVLIPTRELFPTNALNLSGNFRINLKQAWKKSKNPVKETLRNFISITNFRVSQKKEAGSDASAFLVDLNNVFADTNLLDAQYNFRQDVYFFRNDPVGDLKFSFADNQSKLFLSTGDELRGLQVWTGNQRLNFGKSKSLENEARIGRKQSLARQFDTRNYNITFWEVKPKVNFQFSRKFRLSLGYEYKDKQNTNDSSRVDANVKLHKLIVDAKWNLKERNNIFTRLELFNINQTGQASFSAEYELRESFQPGFNALWQVFFTYYLSKNLELSVTYDGRASQNNPILHTGRVQLKAFF